MNQTFFPVISVSETEQAKSISDLITALGKALENHPNPKAKALGETLAQSGDIGGITADMFKLKANSADYLKLVDTAAEVAAGMLGSAGGAAALESFIISSVPRALAVGALASAFPVMGTLALGAGYLGAAYLGGKLVEGAYGWSKRAAEALSTQLPTGAVTLPASFDAIKTQMEFPGAVILDPTYVNDQYDGYALDVDTDQFMRNQDRGIDRDFLHQMQREINDFNFSLSDMFKPGNDFLRPDSNGMLGWSGGYQALQDQIFNSGGLNLPWGDNWGSAFNDKMYRLTEAASSMQDFIDNNFGRANNTLGGSASTLSDKAGEAASDLDSAMAEMTPLALDLGGEGIKTRSIFEGISGFEFVEGQQGGRHGWLDGSSAFLALDRNGNGSIDNFTELFGNVTQDGFTVLRELDSNGDGRIDQADERFEALMVWQDRDQNTRSDAGELHTLREVGIKEISLDQVTRVERPDVNGNTVKWTSSFTLENGETREIADVYFRYSTPNQEAAPDLVTAVDQQVQRLVQSMAGFAAPAAMEFTSAADQRTALNVPLAVGN
ncbi:hypothetical protein [Pseudomonas sp. CAM1A]|uniref:hypothetical protein n=1 Tax=Pseudomonas sp. CAM1A TaxID=3231717 RepID=UPI0039C5E242